MVVWKGVLLWVIYLFFIPVYKIRHCTFAEGLQTYYYYYYYCPALRRSILCECLGKNDRTHTCSNPRTLQREKERERERPINIYETLTYIVFKQPLRAAIASCVYVYNILYTYIKY